MSLLGSSSPRSVDSGLAATVAALAISVNHVSVVLSPAAQSAAAVNFANARFAPRHAKRGASSPLAVRPGTDEAVIIVVCKTIRSHKSGSKQACTQEHEHECVSNGSTSHIQPPFPGFSPPFFLV